MTVTVVILTFNEECHIERALASVKGFASRCVVLDSGSTDRTVELARSAGAEVLTHAFVNQAQQFNWALTQLGDDTEWVLRLDADEVITPDLSETIRDRLETVPQDIAGVALKRRIFFMERPIRRGGIFPVYIVRLFRYGRGRCEERWMDEHIACDGRVIDDFEGEIEDINLNSLSWWIAKHNAYASREAVELLDQKYHFLDRQTIHTKRGNSQLVRKQWLKTHVYARLPGAARAFLYFLYRFVIRFGFLDGKEGAAFHVLQGFWYRYLVDMKVHEVEKYMRSNEATVVRAIEKVLEIRLEKSDADRLS